ncbi:ROK family protein [Armatimonas rosea]|uniref:Glucokinase n=1 Tax=Armatimonas rosea TaxID=685828 RepID=A0A7W9SMZ1_ARMRO|nr:ROK family protein [Armatimonas rosea]MBB6049315.1 glucokinase [Armatimonas rosea]
MSILLGVDIGGTKIAVGLVDAATGQVLYKARIPTEAENGGASVLARAIELAKQVLPRAAGAEGAGVTGIGIGAGGQIDPVAGVVVNATEILPGWKGQRLKTAFEAAFALPAFADNDVNALAVGESRYGAGKDYRHLIYLGLGTGVGGALVHDGKLVHGPRGAGSEPGHLVLYPDAPPYANGTRGCLEQFTSGPAILERFGDPTLTGPELAALAHAGDTQALACLAAVGRDLGIGLATLANIYGPEAFLLGGGVIDGFGELLLAHARAELFERALPAVKETPILRAGLGTDAPLIGAAALAL